MQTLVADIETDNLLPAMTRIWCLVTLDVATGQIDSYDSDSIHEGVRRLAAADRVVMHHGIGFDHPALAKFGYDFPVEKIYDTLVASRLVDPQREGGHSLRAWGESLGYAKGDHEDWSQYSDEMLEYCKRDCEVTLKVYQKIHPIAPEAALNLEFDVARIIASQERNGFTFNIEKAEKLAAALYGERQEAESELKEIFQPIYVPGKEFTPKSDNSRHGYSKGHTLTKVVHQEFNPGSRQQIANRLMRQGWKPKAFTPSGQPEINEGVLKNLPYPEAKAMVKYLRIEKMLSMLSTSDKSWLKLVRDGRIHGEVNTLGARTGRMTHRNPNVAQADGDKRMRELFIPRDGWKLVGVDADGLEARLLGHYLHRFDGGEFADRVVNGDFHSFNQQICDLQDRNSAKRLFFGFMYGAGDGKIGQIVYDDQPYKGSKVAVGKSTRKKLSEGIKGLDTLVSRVRQAATTRGYLKGLLGQRLVTPSAHSALNTLIQGAGATVMKQALSIFDERAPQDGWAYCANIHDEVQIEAHPDVVNFVAETMCVAIRDAGHRLELNCLMDGSFNIGNNWSETH
jgi:DNA polymerase I